MKRLIVFLSFLLSGLLVVLATNLPLQAAIPAAERETLIALYNATNGDNWYSNGGWKTPPLHTDGFAVPGTENNWIGITVSDDHVTKIYLWNKNLNGSIPPELGNLSKLESLNLCENQLSGSIPTELGNLSKLEGLDLSDNQLSGSIPPELGNLSKLELIWLNFNQLSGSIPPELGNLSNLWNLLLGSNRLSGGIPPELGNLSNLMILYLEGNQLSGSIPPELGNLSNLGNLLLNNNQLSGGIPPELGNLSNLTTLYLHGNQLSGSIPPELGNLSNLEGLDLSYNQLSGSIPSQLGNLNNLLALHLYANQLSGNIPPELGNLSNLYFLYLYSNQLSGSIPSELGNLSNLEDLKLDDNQLSGSIPPELGNLSNLTILCLHGNELSGSIPPEFGKLSNLEKLYLSGNQLTGSIPQSLTNLTNLWELHIRYNCLYTNDPDLRAWLSGFDPDWEKYQCENEKDPPFGSFETPIDGSTVCSSIPVTGWVLDDTGVENVKIYREQGNQLIDIGDATLVEGARPDVAAAYPGYPNNTNAGWGYMMLTNFLPNSGNGTFVLHAIASDAAGKTTTLGTKTIHCDNANAVKPFGAIDTPTQGGTASGSSFVNWGWALTPQPNSIPTDGSTIDVFVNGVNLGHPTYNNYRSDIADLFPGYANSSGSVGYFYLDTIPYTNGVHTIYWSVRDSGGNSDGIGSRYFIIQNSSQRAGHMAHSTGQAGVFNVDPSSIPCDYSQPVSMKKGYNKNEKPQTIYPGHNGIISIKIKELERLVIYFFNSETSGTGDIKKETLNVEHRRLNIYRQPIGSTLDAKKGIFYWQPGPGFLGRYNLVFVETKPGGGMTKKNITVEIVPKTSARNMSGK